MSDNFTMTNYVTKKEIAEMVNLSTLTMRSLFPHAGSSCVLYFEQCLGSVHSKIWLKYASSMFFEHVFSGRNMFLDHWKHDFWCKLKKPIFLLYFSSNFFLFLPFQLFCKKNFKNAYFYQCLDCEAPNCRLKYTIIIV